MKIQPEKRSPMKIQFDYRGRFRIVAPDGTTGDWSGYTSLATLTWQGKTYIAGSAYGLLPKNECVYEISPIKTAPDDSMTWIDSADGKDHSAEKKAIEKIMARIIRQKRKPSKRSMIETS